MGGNLTAGWSRHQMPQVHARADGAFTGLQVLFDGVQGGVFHGQQQIRCREHRRQDAVLEAVGKMAHLHAKAICAACAYWNLFHGINVARDGIELGAGVTA